MMAYDGLWTYDPAYDQARSCSSISLQVTRKGGRLMIGWAYERVYTVDYLHEGHPFVMSKRKGRKGLDREVPALVDVHLEKI